MRIVGEIETAFYRLTVRKDDPPPQFAHVVTKWLYSGGEGGIRTHDTLARIPVFETGPFNHSGTSPA
jgi:hypothetical protein